MPRSPLTLIFWAVLVLASGTCGLLAYIYSGVYDISATKQHTSLVYWLLSTARRQSVQTHASEGPPPLDLTSADLIASGLALFEQHCRQCHGAPGIAPDAVGLGMNPSPPNFAQIGRDLAASELYWSISNGIRLTGMPAWKHRLSEHERWAIVAFLRSSPALSPTEYLEQRSRLISAGGKGAASQNSEVPWQLEGAAQRGRAAIQQYACPTCHVIPWIRGPDAQVGPPLGGIAEQIYLAGVLLNTPVHMIEWVRHPQKVKPLSAMPDLGVTEHDARDIAAYLYTLR